MRFQVVSRSSGRTRVSPIVVMKLVSPAQRGMAWQVEMPGHAGSAGFAYVHAEVESMRGVDALQARSVRWARSMSSCVVSTGSAARRSRCA